MDVEVVVITVIGVVVDVVVVESGGSSSTIIPPFSVVTGSRCAFGSVINGSVIISAAFPAAALSRISKEKFNTVPFSITFRLIEMTSTRTIEESGWRYNNDLPAAFAMGPRDTSLKNSLEVSKLRSKLSRANSESSTDSPRMYPISKTMSCTLTIVSRFTSPSRL